MRLVLFSLVCICSLAPARAAEPVTVALNETASVGTALVTIGDVATVVGGDALTRARVAKIDLAELKTRELNVTVGRKAVEYRLLLAGFDPSAVRVGGAERATVTLARRIVTADEVTAAARAELLKLQPNPDMVIELAVPIIVKLPEVPANEKVTISAKPRGPASAAGRVQMDTTISAGGEKLLSFAVHMNVRQAGTPAIVPAGAIAPLPVIPTATPAAGTAFASAEVLIRPRQRVEMQVNAGGLKVTAAGEAQQAGKLGQTILVQNIDSKKVISARVTGPGTVEVDLGGTR